MKKVVLLILAALFAAVSCYDDTALWSELEKHEERLNKLETQCKQMNSNISSIQSIINALNSKDFIDSVQPIKEKGEIVGYTITFSKAGVCTIYNGEDGKNGNTPVIGVRQSNDGVWYWTSDNEWILDSNGNKIKAEGDDGITPEFKIENDNWFITYDKGKTWNLLGKATGEDGDNFFKSVTENDDEVLFVLSDGTKISIPKQKKVDINFIGINGAVGIVPGQMSTVSYEIVNGSDKCIVKAFGQNNWKAYVKPTDSKRGIIEIHAPEELTDEEIIVLLYDGDHTTIMKTISFEKGIIVCNIMTVVVKGSGETVEVDLSSNMAVSASSSASWVTCKVNPATKGTIPYTLTLTAGRNYSEEERIATITVSDASGKVVHTIGVVQPVFDAYENYLDLSGGGETANCYIINKAGEYKFPIVKGNGQKGVIINGDTAELPNAKKAKVVWQDSNIIANVGVNKGYVVFETNSTWYTGNAVLAVTDDNGEILWSWHIWSTSYVLGSDDIPVYNHAKTRLYQMMKYTLGEKGNTAPFYQFGRKDPISLHTTIKTASSGSIDKSIKNPDVFYASSGYDWCGTSYKNLWDAGYTSYNTSSYTASVLKGNKTIYDPCPVGYRVPPDDAFTSFTTTGQNTEDEYYINATYKDMISFLQNNNTYYFYTQSGRSTIKFRAFGGLNAATAKELTNIAYYYSAHPSSSATSRLLQFYAGAVLPLNTDYSRALAGTIRPVRDDVESENVYESTDYSMDGTIVTLQHHTVGNGIKLLLLGDGFTDRDIDNGVYDRSMAKASEYFFDIEPYKSFKDRFDVKAMRVVSQTSVFDEARRTAFASIIGPGTRIEGDLSTAYKKVYDVYGGLDDVTVIIVMNTTEYAGTCYMAGNTISIAFCPMSDATYYPFNTVIHHEAGGHGFANLGDEYSYSGTIPQSEKDYINSVYESYGWYENLSTTYDKTKVNWKNFITNPLYSSSVGVHEGAYGYTYGVYRPTANSCMNHMYGNFNAPSRFKIYKRIKELSGESWSWDSFLEYDSINRPGDAEALNAEYKYDNSMIPPHTPPVFVSPDSLPKF